MQYSELLYELNNFVWLGFVFALLATYLFNAGNKSYYISALVTVITVLIMLALEPIFKQAARDYPWFVWHFWYFTWATFDILAVVLIYLLHKREKVRIDFVAMSCILTFLTLCLIQALRHLDFVVLRTDYMGAGYKVLINTLNMGFFVFLLQPLFAAVKQSHYALSIRARFKAFYQSFKSGIVRYLP